MRLENYINLDGCFLSMKTRELFCAVDSAGVRYNIDKLDKTEARNSKFFCPHCDAEVTPKMGEQKIWHFAHKGELCKYLLRKDAVDSAPTTLGDFSEKTVSVKEFKFSKDPHLFECEKCHTTTNKINGVKWEGDSYICLSCYGKM